MRWYCLHPELPEKAVLRIRTAPNSGAAVCGRVSKGKAIAALAPEFEIADDTLSLAASGSADVPQRWLHVSFPDEISGATTEGYVMASLPDGMRLLVPWEQAGFINCCYIVNASATLFEGPQKTSAAAGLAEEDEGAKYPYGVVAVEGSRACILHDVLESVWIEIAELEPICVRVRHPDCSTPHAFYSLNEDLPPEAQIAIRCFPSKDAETVGLLSRGDTIEVVAQCGNWLQVAAACNEEEGENESWIMWQTDSWTLLVESPEHSSGTCARHASFPDRAADTEVVSRDRAASDGEIAGADERTDSSLVQSDDRETFAPPEANHSDPLIGSVSAELLKGSLQQGDAGNIDESACVGGAGASLDVEDVQRGDVEENVDNAVEDRAPAAATTAIAIVSWEDRPLNVRSRQGSRESSKFEHAGQHEQGPISSPEDDQSETQPLTQQSPLPESPPPQAHWDDRPIRSQKQTGMDWSEELPPTQDFNEEQTSDSQVAAQEQEERAGNDGVGADRTTLPQPGGEDSTSESVAAWDEIPVGGSGQYSWDETPVGGIEGQPSAADDEVEASPSPVSTPERVDEDETEFEEAVPAAAVSSWDETPVGGAGSYSWDETPVGGGTSHSWDETPVGAQRRHSHSHDDDAASLSEPMIVDVRTSEDECPLVLSEGAMVEAETLAGGEIALPWDETPFVTQNLPSSAVDDDVELHLETMTVATREQGGEVTQVVLADRMSSWDETPVGGGSRRVWDETPVGNGSSPSWEEHPIKPHNQSGGSGDDDDDEDDEIYAEAITVDEPEGGGESKAASVDTPSSETETPVGGSGDRPWDGTPVGESKSRAWDETPVGGGTAHSYAWDERPIGVRKRDIGADGVGDADEDLQAELTTGGAIEEQAEDAAAPVQPSSSWDETPVGGGSRRVWDETPVGGGSSYSWDASPAEAPVSVNLDRSQRSESSNSTESGALEPDVSSTGSRLGRLLEMELLSSRQMLDDSPGDAFAVDRDQGRKLSLTDLHELVEPALAWDEVPVGGSSVQMDERSTCAPDFGEERDEGLIVEAMIVDSTETGEPEMHENDHPAPVRDAYPVANGQGVDDDGQFYGSRDAEKQLQTDTSSSLSHQSHAFVERAQSVVHRRATANGMSFANRRARKLEFSHSENASGGLSFLLEFGIRAYCRHKQILIGSNEEMSRILFEAVVYGDDPEIILEALTADEPACDDWMTFSPSKVRVVSSGPDPSSFLDVLYARTPGEAPSTPKQIKLHQAQQLQTPPYSSGARKEKIDRMFNRTPVKQRSTPTYDLIMNNADVDKILEAEFGSEACELSILGPYKYPTLTGNRVVGKASRSPVGDYGVAASGLSRFPSAFQTTPPIDAASKVGISLGGYAARAEPDAPPSRSATPPAEGTANPLKRAASGIAKTLPVQVAKTASAPSVISAAAEAGRKQASAALPSASVSRLGARPSSSTSSLGASSVLRRPSPQPIADPALPRPRSSLTSGSSSGAPAARSSIMGTLPRPGQSLLQRKSFLPTASPAKSSANLSATTRDSMAGQIAQATNTSSMQARRTSFGFVRPKTAIPAKK